MIVGQNPTNTESGCNSVKFIVNLHFLAYLESILKATK